MSQEYEMLVRRWQEESSPPVPAKASISSIGMSAGVHNWWWEIDTGKDKRRVQHCVLRDVVFCHESYNIYGTTTVLSPKDGRFFGTSGIYWDDSYQLDIKKGGFFTSPSEAKVRSGLYVVLHHLGLDVVRPVNETMQSELSYE